MYIVRSRPFYVQNSISSDMTNIDRLGYMSHIMHFLIRKVKSAYMLQICHDVISKIYCINEKKLNIMHSFIFSRLKRVIEKHTYYTKTALVNSNYDFVFKLNQYGLHFQILGPGKGKKKDVVGKLFKYV